MKKFFGQLLVATALRFILIALVVTPIFLTIYAVAQQVVRQAANDPQIQLAEDGAAALAAGKKVDELVPKDKVDMSKSLAPFIIVFDNFGKVASSSAVLDSNLPILPAGVLDYTRNHKEDRITWEPKAGVRIAMVIVHFDGGFVLAGRSMREVEIREDRVFILVVLAFAATMLAALVGTVLLEIFNWARKSA